MHYFQHKSVVKKNLFGTASKADSPDKNCQMWKHKYNRIMVEIKNINGKKMVANN